MEKDLASFERHDQVYRSVDAAWVQARLQRLESDNYFELYGFKRALDRNPSVRFLHIDVGSGAGWLLKHTAPLFRSVIGIEPSETAVNFAKGYTAAYKNIQYSNADMVDALGNMAFSDPYFITTAAVFSHIQDFHVQSALSIINNAPVGSVLLFCEPYDKNIHQPFWYIRNQEWWRAQLPNWRLEFLDIRAVVNGKQESYKKGVYGVCVGPHTLEQVGLAAQLSRNVRWFVGGWYYKARYAIVKIYKRLFKVPERLM